MFSRSKQKEAILRYQRVFNTEDGQRVLRDLLQSCNFTTTSFSTDPYQMAFNEGARSVVLRLLDTLNINIEQLEKHFKRQEELEDEI